MTDARARPAAARPGGARAGGLSAPLAGGGVLAGGGGAQAPNHDHDAVEFDKLRGGDNV
jgi:hypothetical protein